MGSNAEVDWACCCRLMCRWCMGGNVVLLGGGGGCCCCCVVSCCEWHVLKLDLLDKCMCFWYWAMGSGWWLAEWWLAEMD